jgi:hypothetical protein
VKNKSNAVSIRIFSPEPMSTALISSVSPSRTSKRQKNTLILFGRIEKDFRAIRFEQLRHFYAYERVVSLRSSAEFMEADCCESNAEGQ